MDPISASCYNLGTQPSEQKNDERYSQILGSTVSISNYETRNFKNLTPQILAAVLATSYHIAVGISLAYSAVLLPQLEEDPEFKVTKSDASWIASIVALSTPVGCLIVGFLMDYFGRLRTIAMASIPAVSGCVVMALANNIPMLIVGRGLIGFATGLGSSPAIVYLTEIARKDMRGSLISLAPALASLGMVLTFILGSFMNWRTLAWCTNILIVIPCLVVFLIPESPVWLVSKGRIDEARKSLMWMNRYQPQPANKTHSISELQLALLQKEHELKMFEISTRKDNQFMVQIHAFMKPTGYKPMLILIFLFFFQQFSGIFIFLFFSINFFQEVGSTVNPYMASVFIGVVRFVMSMVNTYVLRTFGRRSLVMISCVGMSVCIFFSGLFTYWTKNGTTTLTWVPVVFLLMFVLASMVGVVPIPFTMTAELFPLEIRGVANSMSICIANFLMFMSLQLHPTFDHLFGGIAGEQFYFSVVCLVAVIFVYIFLPETHNKRLSEIEEYFKSNVVFIGKKKQEVSRVSENKIRRSIVRKQGEHEEHLLEEV